MRAKQIKASLANQVPLQYTDGQKLWKMCVCVLAHKYIKQQHQQQQGKEVKEISQRERETLKGYDRPSLLPRDVSVSTVTTSITITIFGLSYPIFVSYLLTYLLFLVLTREEGN